MSEISASGSDGTEFAARIHLDILDRIESLVFSISLGVRLDNKAYLGLRLSSLKRRDTGNFLTRAHTVDHAGSVEGKPR